MQSINCQGVGSDCRKKQKLGPVLPSQNSAISGTSEVSGTFEADEFDRAHPLFLCAKKRAPLLRLQ